MAAVLGADVLEAQMQVVLKMLPLIQSKYKHALSLLPDASSNKAIKRVSDQNCRIPLIVRKGGDYGIYDQDGGDMGRGSGAKIKEQTITYIPTKFALELSDKAIYTTEDQELSAFDALKYQVAEAIPEMTIYNDIEFHTGSQGILAQASNHSSGVYTFDDSAFGADRLRENMPVNVFDTTLTTQKTTDSGTSLPRVSALDVLNKTATISGGAGISGGANTDKVLLQGVGATPAARYGLYYFNDAATTGNLLGLSRATYPEIRANSVNAQSGTLSRAHYMLLLHRIYQRRGAETTNLMALIHQCQRAQILNEQYQITTLMLNGGTRAQSVDLQPDPNKDFDFADIMHRVDPRQDRSRVDVIAPKYWGRVFQIPTRMKKVQGRTEFEVRGSSGGVATARVFYIEQAENRFCYDCGRQGYIYGIAVDSQY